jgi:hypothetical protein
MVYFNIDIYIYVHTHTHTHIYIYIYTRIIYPSYCEYRPCLNYSKSDIISLCTFYIFALVKSEGINVYLGSKRGQNSSGTHRNDVNDCCPDLQK